VTTGTIATVSASIERVSGHTTAIDLDARIRALECELAELRHRQREERDASWLCALAVAIGAVRFSSADLICHAAVNHEFAASLDGMSARQIGQRLAAVSGRVLGGGSLG